MDKTLKALEDAINDNYELCKKYTFKPDEHSKTTLHRLEAQRRALEWSKSLIEEELRCSG